VVLLGKGEVSFVGPPSDLDQEQLVEHYLGVDQQSRPVAEVALASSRVGGESRAGIVGDSPVGPG
jgi:hypothetical protein